MREGIYSRSLETKFSVMSNNTFCLVTDSKIRPCVFLTGQHVQKVKNSFLLVPLCSESFKIIFLLENYFLSLEHGLRNFIMLEDKNVTYLEARYGYDLEEESKKSYRLKLPPKVTFCCNKSKLTSR